MNGIQKPEPAGGILLGSDGHGSARDASLRLRLCRRRRRLRLQLLGRRGQEDPQALHYHQVAGELDRTRTRQVPRSPSTVIKFAPFIAVQFLFCFWELFGDWGLELG